MRYAVSIADLQAWSVKKGQFCGPLLLLWPVLSKDIVEAEGKRWDGDSLLVREDTSPERWQAIMTIIREEWKLHKNYDLRIYQSKTGKGRWKRI